PRRWTTRHRASLAGLRPSQVARSRQIATARPRRPEAMHVSLRLTPSSHPPSPFWGGPRPKSSGKALAEVEVPDGRPRPPATGRARFEEGGEWNELACSSRQRLCLDRAGAEALPAPDRR